MRRPVADFLRGGWRGSVPLLTLGTLLLLCALGGGSAFADTPSLLFVRPAAVLALGVFLLAPGQGDWRAVRAPALFLAALALLIALQLVPLPPAVWLALPGRGPYAEAAAAAGLPQPWRPVSLTPDLTLNSLVSLVVPAAVLAGFARLDGDDRRRLAPGLIALCAASAVLGVAQFAGGQGSALYLYRRTHDGFPVGLLANRNHQAALLAAAYPALRVWTLFPAANPGAARRRAVAALVIGACMAPVILATGSRAGIALAAFSLALTALLFPPASRPAGAPGARGAALLRWGTPVLLLALAGLSWWLGRAASIDRLSSVAAIEADQRFQFAPVVTRIIRDTFPAGTGFGGFDPVFRQHEPDSALIASYFNHAHNELLELAMTGGLPALLLLAAFLLWWGARVAAALRRSRRDRLGRATALLGALVVSILLAASLTDYPLRTPLMMAVFALACGWLGARDRPASDRSDVAMPGELR